MLPDSGHPDPLPILRERFGHAAMFPLQERIVRRVLGGGDALVVMPTGSGKSLCYQLPALTLPGPGTSLVFSPLIALMEDQVAALRAKGIRAQYINSSLRRAERERRYAKLAEGAYELVYATPERMHKPEFVQALANLPGSVKLLAVDEAHCITKWGHDFRPAYQQVGQFRRALRSPPTVALTATATAEVRTDIRRTLGLDEVQMPLFASGIDRPNLRFEVLDCWDDDAKLAALAEVARAWPGTGIVYFSLIKQLELFAARISELDLPLELVIYHGQLDAAEKQRVYQRFIQAGPDQRLLLLATNAFGMGVDKSDIRFIVHAQVPGSVESWYQEVGRSGRDGRPSLCSLLYCQDDLAVQQQFVEWMNPDARMLAEAAHHAQAWPHGEFDVDDLRPLLIRRDRGDRRAEACLTVLEKQGVIAPVGSSGRYRFVRPPEADEFDPADIEAKRERDLHRLLDVVKLIKADDQRAFVIDYFGLDADA
ncbi:MAG: ATP-dependent DNA helicase [Planctomycetota bacterium]|nr:MAG: ATP-dependent DNA helicase [Planctomycetota bacterium]